MMNLISWAPFIATFRFLVQYQVVRDGDNFPRVLQLKFPGNCRMIQCPRHTSACRCMARRELIRPWNA